MATIEQIEQIEQIKQQLLDIIELSDKATPGRWSPASKSIWSPNSRVCNDAETDDMVFVCRARNLTPKMAKALLGVIEWLELYAIPTNEAQAQLETIRREWEAQE